MCITADSVVVVVVVVVISTSTNGDVSNILYVLLTVILKCNNVSRWILIEPIIM